MRPLLRRSYLVLVLLGLVATVASCKVRRGDSALLDSASPATVKVGADFLSELLDSVKAGISSVVTMKDADEAFIAEHKRAMSKDVTSLSSALSDFVLWFDELKQKTISGEFPETYTDIEGREFDQVQGKLAAAQQSLTPLLAPAFWQTIDAKKTETMRQSLGECAFALTDALVVVKRWNSSSAKWLSKSYTRVKGFKSSLMNQQVGGKYPTDAELLAAYEEDKATKAKVTQQILASTSKSMPAPFRGQKVIELMSRVEELKSLFAEPSGTGECYTIIEHTRRVIANWFDQVEAHGGYPENSPLPPHLMALTVALHDIGKPLDVHRKAEQSGVPYKCGQPTTGRYDSSGQHVHNADIVRAALKALGASEHAQAIGYQLHGHDTLGELAKGEINITDAYTDVAAAAKAAGMTPEDFFAILRPFYLSDAGAYPGIYGSSVRLYNNGRLVNANVDQLKERIVWEKQEAERREQARIAAEKARLAKIEADRIAAEKAKEEAAKAEAEAKAKAEELAAAEAERQKQIEAARQAAANKPSKAEVSTLPGAGQTSEGQSGGEAVAKTSEETRPAETAAPAKVYAMKDFCCNKTYVTDPQDGQSISVKGFYQNDPRAWGSYRNSQGQAADVTISVKDGKALCIQATHWPKASCFDIVSATALKFGDKEKWVRLGN